jgi:hypothetical protein
MAGSVGVEVGPGIAANMPRRRTIALICAAPIEISRWLRRKRRPRRGASGATEPFCARPNRSHHPIDKENEFRTGERAGHRLASPWCRASPSGWGSRLRSTQPRFHHRVSRSSRSGSCFIRHHRRNIARVARAIDCDDDISTSLRAVRVNLPSCLPSCLIALASSTGRRGLLWSRKWRSMSSCTSPGRGHPAAGDRW